MLPFMLTFLYSHPLISVSNLRLLLFLSIFTLATTNYQSMCIDVLSSWNLRASIENKCPDWLVENYWISYDVKDGEGFYLQRNVFDRMALAVTQLNEVMYLNKMSKPAVLILPPFCNIAHWAYDSKRRLPWSVFYNIQRNRLPIIEYDIYKKLIGTGNMTAGVIGLNFDWSNKSLESSTSVEYYKKHELSRLKHLSSKCTFDRYIRGETVIFGGQCELVNIAHLICISFFRLMRPEEVSRELYKLFGSNQKRNQLQTYLIKHADGILVTWPWELRKYGILGILNYNDNIKRHAQFYMSANAFFDEKKPYISVHLRRNDFVFVRSNDVPTFSQVLNRLLQLSKDLDIERVVISTDGTEGEKNELREMFLKHSLRLHIINIEAGSVDDGIISAVSQVILLNGEYFIGTKDSRFSSSIAWDCILSRRDRENDTQASYNKCSEVFCGRADEKQSICREHSDRLPLLDINVT